MSEDTPPPDDADAAEIPDPHEESGVELIAEVAPDLAAESVPGPRKAPVWVRLLGLLVLVVALVVIGRLTGLSDYLGDPERLQAQVQDAGAWGVLILIAAFTVGLFIQVPGIVFATAAIFCYGRLWGGLLAYFGAVIAVSSVFVCVRGVGGQALSEIEKPWVKKILSQIDTHPLRTVTLLRLVFWSSPQLNYALALSKVSFRNHLLGTMIGLIPIKIAVAFGIQEVLDVLKGLFS